MTVEPFSNATVPVAPDVTMALKSMSVPAFWGPFGDALSVVVEDVAVGDVAGELLADAPTPPALEAKTLKVYEVDAVRPGTEHDVPIAEAVHVNPPGLDVTV
jgi:hypothetical protein